jgi:hypothetical protein
MLISGGNPMRRITLLIAGVLLMLSAALSDTSAAGQLVDRGQMLKRKLSPSAQRILSKIQLGFDAALTENPGIRSGELSVLARNKAREGFPRASVDQVDSVAIILLSDWVVRQKSEVRQRESAKPGVGQSRGQPSRPGGSAESLSTDSELALIRLNDLITKANFALEQMAKLLEEKNKTMEQILDNF